MYKNVGKQIKTIANILCHSGVALSVIIGLLSIEGDETSTFIGLGIIVVGSLISWLGSIFTYGFGELVEDTHYIKMKFYNENRGKPSPPQNVQKPLPKINFDGIVAGEEKQLSGMSSDGIVTKDVLDDEWACPECCRINKNTNICKCGYKNG